jgi:glycosyltransferase involved in cell wall biosynthesis
MHNEPLAPLVSVCCITYKHEEFLGQAVESVLMQQTPFAVELVIGEDCSPDATRRIALDYEARFPGRVRVLQHAHNLGVMGNLVATLNACTGRYIAFMEGDDYWTDPLKLQRQVEIMEAQPECALCIHDAEVFMQDGSAPSYLFSTKYPQLLPAHGGRITQADLVKHGWGIASASMLFRSTSLLPLPEWFAHVFSGDYTMQLLSTQHGYIYYLPQVMSRYRVHAGGITQNQGYTLIQNEKRIFELQQYKRLMPTQPHELFDKFLEYLYFERSGRMREAGNRSQQVSNYLKAITINGDRFRFHFLRLLKRTVGAGGSRRS